MSSIQPALSCDELWKQVMLHVTSRHAALANQWEIVDSKGAHSRLCYECNAGAQYSSVLIKCRHDGCTNFYHLDCAHNSKGEFYLDIADGHKLEFDCEEHFVPPKFCLCKSEYDASKSMLLCDDCHEWYHYDCIKISEKKAPDQYICKDCTALKKEGKKVPDKVVQRNKSKDETSARALDAFKAIDVLTEIVSNVCPLVDSTPPRTPSIWSIKEIDGAVRIVSSKLWSAEYDRSGEEIEKFGTEDLVGAWRAQLVEARNTMALWINSGMDKVQHTIRRFDAPSLSDAKYAEIADAMADLLQLETNARDIFHIADKSGSRDGNDTPADIKWFVEFCELAKLLKDTLDLLHTPPALSSTTKMDDDDDDDNDDDDKEEEWLRELNSMVKANASKARAKENRGSAVMTEFVKICRGYFSLVEEFVEEIRQAAESLQQISLGKRSITLGSLLELLKGLDSLPVQPRGAAALRATVAPLLDVLEKDVGAALDQACTDRETVYALKSRTEQYHSISIPSQGKLDFVIARIDFLEDPGVQKLSIGDERIAAEALAELRTRLSKWPLAREFCEDKTSPTSALSGALDAKVAAVDAQITSLWDEATAATAHARILLDGEMGDPSAPLAPLRGLKVVTVEERALEYLLTSGRLMQRVGEVLARSAVASTSALSALQAELRSELENRVSHPSRAFKIATMKLINANEKLNECEKEVSDCWNNVTAAVQQCAEGCAPSGEELQLLLSAALQLGFADAGVQDAATALLAKAALAAETVEKSLPKITNALQDLPLSSQLLRLVETLPLPSSLAAAVRRRFEVCSAVHSCVDLDCVVRSAALEEETLLQARTLRLSLQELTARPSLSPEERGMLSSARRHYAAMFHYEARYSLEESGTEAETLSLISWGATLDDLSAKEAGALVALQEAVQRVGAYKRRATEYMSALRAAITASNSVLAAAEAREGEEREESFLQAIAAFVATMASAGEGAADAACTIRDVAFDEEVKEAAECVRIVKTASAMFTRCNSKLRQDLETENPDNITVADLEADRLDGITLRDFAAADAVLQRGLKRYEHSSLFAELARSIGDLHVAACEWNESALLMVPKRTRKKTKVAQDGSSDKTTCRDVLKAFLQPISRIIMTPTRDVLINLLLEASELQSTVQSVLLSGAGETAAGDDFAEQIERDDMTIQALLQRVEAMPVHMREVSLLRWMAQVLHFMKNVPPPQPTGGDDDGLSISYELAKHHDKQGTLIISGTPEGVALLLAELGALEGTNESPEQVSVRSLRVDVMESLRRSHDYLDSLRSKMAETLALQTKALDIIHADELRLDALQDVETALRRAVVQPDASVFASIQQTRNKATKKSARPVKTPAERSAAGDSEPEDEEWESDAGDALPEGEEQMPQRSKGAIKKKAVAAAAAAQPRDKKRKAGPACLLPDCASTIDAQSPYCSDACCVADAKRLFLALLDGKRRLCAAAIDPTFPQAKRPYPQFDADLAAFALRPHDAAAVYGRITQALAARGLDTSKASEATGAALPVLLRNRHPVVPASSAQGIASHSVANIRWSLPAAAKELFGADSGSELRKNIRESFEKNFFESLRRLGVRGQAALAAVFAELVEDELHCQRESAEQYKKQALMLIRNLKQKHNDPLVSRDTHSSTFIGMGGSAVATVMITK